LGLPLVLLVDDSAAVIEFERAALSRHYAIAVAADGREALARMAELTPAAVILDLSMPKFDGDQVLAAMAARPELQRIPVLVATSEHSRGAACLAAGAAAFLPKPLRGDELLATVARMIAEANRKARCGALAILTLRAGPFTLAIPLACVERVALQPATLPLPIGPTYLAAMVEIEGEAVGVLDLALRLGVVHAAPVVERKLVVVAHDGQRLALCVDDVFDPEEIEPEAVQTRADFGGAEYGVLREALVAVVRSERGLLPVVAPEALLSPGLWQSAAEAVARAARHSSVSERES